MYCVSRGTKLGSTYTDWNKDAKLIQSLLSQPIKCNDQTKRLDKKKGPCTMHHFELVPLTLFIMMHAVRNRFLNCWIRTVNIMSARPSASVQTSVRSTSRSAYELILNIYTDININFQHKMNTSVHCPIIQSNLFDAWCLFRKVSFFLSIIATLPF